MLVALLVAGCNAVRSSDQPQDESPITVQTGMVPIGGLGVPLGQLVLLEGTRYDQFKSGVGTLKIEKIDGKAVASPTFVWIENVDLPKEQRCAIRGYETMEMVGQAPAYEQLAKLSREPRPSVGQLGWQIALSFVALEAVEPKSLEIRKPGP